MDDGSLPDPAAAPVVELETPPRGLAQLETRAQIGIDAPLVTVEVLLSGGLPTFSIVGLAETAVRESKDRVRGALLSSGFEFPRRRITVSLGPADMPKSGGRFDLAIALGILVADRQVSAGALTDYEFYGELGLAGEIRDVPGLLPAALKAARGGKTLIVPAASAAEAALAPGRVLAAASLLEVTSHLRGDRPLAAPVAQKRRSALRPQPDLADVRGQQLARRALEVAAAGGHHLLYCGPPGAGKSMLARRLPGILPPLTAAEALETATVRSVLGEACDRASLLERPFRAPHHTASAVALVGGGAEPRPGEISRAHNGVLFLDELPEFSRHVLEVLREPIETGSIAVARAARQAEFPARFQLVAAMNPCPCGWLGAPRGDCRCSEERVRAYRDRVSGPLLDRIDLQVLVQPLTAAALRPGAAPSEASGAVRERVVAARLRQRERGGQLNSALEGAALDRCCGLPEAGWKLLDHAMRRFAMSARAHQRVRRVARTIADLAGAENIAVEHVSEALALRQFDRRPGSG